MNVFAMWFSCVFRESLVLVLTLSAAACSLSPFHPAPFSDKANHDADESGKSLHRSKHDHALELRVRNIVSHMTLEQKIGQMTQAEIRSISAEDIRRYYIGSVLNGGGSRPQGNSHAAPQDWAKLSQELTEASLATDMEIKVPLIWGTDAVHGHNNVYGATLFPHNIGLGAANNPALTEEIGVATAKAVRATGIDWVFAPTLAVARDDRWGRTYESFSEDPSIVAKLGGAYVKGLQRGLGGESGVVSTAKHFMGDGGTEFGKDQGVNRASYEQMMRIHSPGYVAALNEGVQTVMASFHSWNDVASGVNYGKMHGSRYMLTELLKVKMGFDGFVVSDWNGIGQIPGCTNSSCAQAINAGIDMVMVPEEWKSFIANTVAQVRSGQIAMSRIDDAVTRIVRVKMRAGLFERDRSPVMSDKRIDSNALQSRELARRAVRESMVLLKNNGNVLPLQSGKKILVVGKSADSIANQSGGWSMTWQGTGLTNNDFPNGVTILGSIRKFASNKYVVYSVSGDSINVKAFDAVIAVIGETPYAEGNGDIPPSSTLRHTQRYPEDLEVLQRVSGKGVPVITVFISGRAVYANDLLNLSDAFVAAWLPGTEGDGVTDLLFRRADGSVNAEFSGRLPFSWPKSACQTPLNIGDANYIPLFPFGFGLTTQSVVSLGKLNSDYTPLGCDSGGEHVIFNQSPQGAYAQYVSSSALVWPETEIGNDPNQIYEYPSSKTDIQVSTTQINTQQDAKLIRWNGPASYYLKSSQSVSLEMFKDAALTFDTIINHAPNSMVTISMSCGPQCGGSVDVTRLFKQSPLNSRRSIKIPLSCFAERGVDLSKVNMPFSIITSAAFSAAFTHIRIVSDAARDADAAHCAELH